MICGEVELLGQRIDERQQVVFGHQVDLGQHQKDRAVELANQSKQELIFAGPIRALISFLNCSAVILSEGSPQRPGSKACPELDRIRTSLLSVVSPLDPAASNRLRQLHPSRSVHQHQHQVRASPDAS